MVAQYRTISVTWYPQLFVLGVRFYNIFRLINCPILLEGHHTAELVLENLTEGLLCAYEVWYNRRNELQKCTRVKHRLRSSTEHRFRVNFVTRAPQRCTEWLPLGSNCTLEPRTKPLETFCAGTTTLYQHRPPLAGLEKGHAAGNAY
eukprot:1743539-Rhodomonas_salina.1